MPRLVPARRRPAAPRGTALAVAFGLALLPAVASAQGVTVPGAAPSRAAQPSAALVEQGARQAAERILSAVRLGDANGYYALLAPDSQRLTSPAMVASVFRGLPRLLSWRIGRIEPGLDSSSVLADLATSAGAREVLLIVDGQGRMERFTINAGDQAAEDVVRRFMAQLSAGHFIAADSVLSPSVQEEIPPGTLQAKWLNLQRLTGSFQRVVRLWQEAQNQDSKLVIVTVQFNRLTDNLFVTLNRQNQIVGVDFPTDASPGAVAAP